MATRQKLRQSLDKAKTKMKEKEKRKLLTTFASLCTVDNIVETLSEANGKKIELLQVMFEVHQKIVVEAGELIYFAQDWMGELYREYNKWYFLLGPDTTSLSQFVAKNNECLAHEYDMITLYEDEEQTESERMNEDKLKEWRGDVKERFEDLGYSTPREGFEGMFVCMDRP